MLGFDQREAILLVEAVRRQETGSGAEIDLGQAAVGRRVEQMVE